MHELSLCHTIIQIAARAAQGRQIAHLYLDVGTLRQVIPETLVYCWSIVSENTPMAGSKLIVNQIPAVIKCDDCQNESTITGVPILVCATCQSGKITVVSGEEFILRSMDTTD